MKKFLTEIEKFAREQTNKFIAYILIVTTIGFYLGFVFGRWFAIN